MSVSLQWRGAEMGAQLPGTGGGWLAVWNSGVPLRTPPSGGASGPLGALTLCLEFTVPRIGGRRLVRLWQGAASSHCAIALYAAPDGRLRLVHGEIDIATGEDFARPGETVSLRYRACARGREDVVEFRCHDRHLHDRQRAGLARAARIEEAMPRDPRFLAICHVAAVADHGVSSSDLPGVAEGSLLPTARGLVAVERLSPGDLLVTVDGDRLPLRWVDRRSRLCLGRQAPVRLRAPYFGLERDLCVSPETRIMRSGPAVEYMFGHEQVLVRAADLTNSPGALRDRRFAVRDIYHLMLDDHACIAVGRCGVETALLSDVLAGADTMSARNLVARDRMPCLPAIDRAAAQALIAASARGRRALG